MAAGRPIGILAGGGTLVVEIAEAIGRGGRPVHIVALEGEAGPEIERFAHTWVGWGEVGGMLEALRAAGCRELAIAGSVRRPDIARIRPDLGFVRHLPSLLAMLKGGDDSVLSRVVRFFESQGIAVRGIDELAPELVARAGALTAREPSAVQLAAAARGFDLLAALGPLDVGQAAVVSPDRVLAVEGAEGTDGMLDRVGGIARSAGAVLVKRPKLGQELRVDMPAIGPRTVEKAAAAGLAGIAVQANLVLLADKGRLAALADERGLFVIGLERDEAMVRRRQRPRKFRETVAWRPLWSGPGLTPFSRGALDRMTHRDVAKGLAVVAAAAPFGTGEGAIVVRQYALGIAAGEGAASLAARCDRLRQWGRAPLARRRGALVVAAPHLEAIGAEGARRLVDHAVAGCLACVAIARGSPARDVVDALARAAERRIPVGLAASGGADHGR